MKYAEGKKFQQISINTLFFTTWIVIIYAICAFATLPTNTEKLIATIMGSILLVVEIMAFFWRNRQIMKDINEALNS